MPLLEVRDIAFEAGGRRILDGLSLSVEAGEVLALLGPNGTGKSTLGHLLMGCAGYAPRSGEVLFDGEPLLPLPLHLRARRGIGLAWQEPVRFEGVTVGRYLTLSPGGPGPAALLAAVGLPAATASRMADRCLSGGERKRVELASLLALPLRLAILDEPDSGIDMLSLDDVARVIRAFPQRGAAVLLITHREEIALVADRAAQLCRGRIADSGPPAQVAARYRALSCPACAAPEAAETGRCAGEEAAHG